jgi:5'-nucleotidase / UDP-sugar diphosphatase
LHSIFSGQDTPILNDELPLIASNLVIPEGHDLHKTGLSENHIFELPGGLKLGVFGILGESAYSVAGYAEPVTITDQYSAARKQVVYSGMPVQE